MTCCNLGACIYFVLLLVVLLLLFSAAKERIAVHSTSLAAPQNESWKLHIIPAKSHNSNIIAISNNTSVV